MWKDDIEIKEWVIASIMEKWNEVMFTHQDVVNLQSLKDAHECFGKQTCIRNSDEDLWQLTRSLRFDFTFALKFNMNMKNDWQLAELYALHSSMFTYHT